MLNLCSAAFKIPSVSRTCILTAIQAFSTLCWKIQKFKVPVVQKEVLTQALHIRFQLRNPGKVTVGKAAVHRMVISHPTKVRKSLIQHLCLVVEVSLGILWCLGNMMIPTRNKLVAPWLLSMVFTVRRRAWRDGVCLAISGLVSTGWKHT